MVCNFTPSAHENYLLGLPRAGKIKEVFNSDRQEFFGTGNYKNDTILVNKTSWQSREYSASIKIAPLGMIAFKYE